MQKVRGSSPRRSTNLVHHRPTRHGSADVLPGLDRTPGGAPRDQSSTGPTVTLNNGVVMPAIGFGVFQVPPEATAAVVAQRAGAGYRSIDTAAIYDNEVGTGDGIRASGLAREDVFLTTKVWNDEQGYDSTLAAFDASIGRLGVDYVDLYLIHWPCPVQDRYLDTWRAFERLLADGRVRAIGVSNFQPAHLERLRQRSGIVPAINQVELHPLLQQRELRAYHAAHGIATEAWSPLVRGRLLGDPTIAAIAARHDRSAGPGRAGMAPRDGHRSSSRAR